MNQQFINLLQKNQSHNVFRECGVHFSDKKNVKWLSSQHDVNNTHWHQAHAYKLWQIATQ